MGGVFKGQAPDMMSRTFLMVTLLISDDCMAYGDRPIRQPAKGRKETGDNVKSSAVSEW